jgi:small subunit ribosomal protein S14
MARKAMIEKTLRTPKYKVRLRNRCQVCGRPRGFLRKFQMCRICFRLYSLRGAVPGVIKSSW